MQRSINIKIYSTNNEDKLTIAERFARYLRNKIFRYKNVVSKKLYFHKHSKLVKEYKNTIHRTIKMKPADVKPETYINVTANCKTKKLNIRLLIMLKFQILEIFNKTTHQICQKKCVRLKKLKIQQHERMKLAGRFLKRNCKKTRNKWSL